MAAPIQQVVRNTKSKEELEAASLQSLLTAVVQNKASLEDTLRIMQELHDSGILEALHAMLTAKEKIAKILVEQALRPEATALINNMMSVMGGLTKLDPEATGALMNGLAEGMAEGTKATQSPKKIGVFALAKTLKDPDVNRTLKFAIGFLKGLGKTL
ncbi:DUF1641 domain-containing protein [Alicyclobacillus fastidiosus]|uniref:DUF1641 domain-containing protein n=1 Tax=Alicyclobacillus fastidiosus TaxID=392011 RepID=A0ABY6ZEV8_9BACL|nr:DUF1641 domain-containing protein [Alicyclobacillus fastidiosus]WAH40694.1 DUF1641 domain-containing protein [Alicyclobacillus fastidiosus]